MAFKSTRKTVSTPDSPEEMYEDYKHRKIKGILSHQADSIRGYLKVQGKKNIALELPTGSGKTLVGLIIAEWRRRKFNEKVLFLCPTRQLVHQVKQQAEEKYGISVEEFTGKASEYSDEKKTVWRTNEKVAITTYSSYFNTNTFFRDAKVLIFDDAHSSENYISSLWDFKVSATKQPELFEALALIIKSRIASTDYSKMCLRDSPEAQDPLWVEKLPAPYFAELKDEIISSVAAYLSENDNAIKYQWRMISNNLSACNFYFTQNEISIRPLVPPTETHNGFSQSHQRIFMSATLGRCGDLERITGLAEIAKVPCPDKWKKRSVGRKLFFFPDFLFSSEKTDILIPIIREANKALFITSAGKEIEKFVGELSGELPKHKVVSIDEFEKDPDLFFEEENAILTMANRYDGIDLEGDKCRLLILHNISTILNLQDKFLATRLGSSTIFHDRIATRLTQAAGRCTRSETDFAAVVVLGSELTDFYYNKTYRNLLHPELQAEITFGAEESTADGLTINDFIENFKIFMKQGDEWQDQEANISDIRSTCTTSEIAGQEQLERAAILEVKLVYSLWADNFTEALDYAKSILGTITHESLKGYRTFWNYYTGSISSFDKKQRSKKIGADEEEYFRLAAKSSVSIRWLSSLASSVSLTEKTEDSNDIANQLNGIINVFRADGLSHNRKFDQRSNKILKYTQGGDSTAFEMAQLELGKFLGFQVGKIESEGSPDPWWQINDTTFIVFEDNNEANSTNSVSTTKARQAATHINWLKANMKIEELLTVHQVLITPKTSFSKGATAQLQGAGVSIWLLSDYSKWVSDVLSSIREIRKGANLDDLDWRIRASEMLIKTHLTGEAITQHLQKMKLQKEAGK